MFFFFEIATRGFGAGYGTLHHRAHLYFPVVTSTANVIQPCLRRCICVCVQFVLLLLVFLKQSRISSLFRDFARLELMFLLQGHRETSLLQLISK
jgi:hypothetical protein